MTTPYPSPWPANFQGCTITGRYLKLDGTPVQGTVSFAASPDGLLDAEDTMIIVPVNLTATLDMNGALSIVVPATDDPDINPHNWTYAVSENFVGGRKYSIRAPQNTTIDLSVVAPVPSSLGQPIWRGASGLPLGEVAAPSTATSAGVAGQMAYDSSYLYVCVATNIWKRTALASW